MKQLNKYTIKQLNDTKDSPGISVIICCYNSAQYITTTLTHLFNQQLAEDLQLEIIVVDNACADNTMEIAREVSGRHLREKKQVTVRYIEEKTPGLNYARFAGVRAVSSEYLIFCDDDNFLHTEYCRRAYEIMEKDPSIGACGGCGEPIFENGPAPHWFTDLNISYAWGPQSSEEGYINGYTLYGAGLILRTSWLKKLLALDYHPLLVDRAGKELSGGGDEELTMWCKILGYQLYYSPRLMFQHFIKKQRLTKKYLKELYRGHGKTLAHLVPLQILLFHQGKGYKSTWFYQQLKWALIALRHCLDARKNTHVRQLDCIANKNRVATLWQERALFGEKVKYVMEVRRS